MGFESIEEKKENKIDTQFEGGGVDLDTGDLSSASPVAAPRRTMRDRQSIRARVAGSASQSQSAAAPTERRAGIPANSPARRPIMRSNSEFGYLFNDSEPVDNHMDEQYTHRLDALAYDGRQKGDEGQYSDILDGEQQSVVRRPENRMSAAAYEPQTEPAEGRRSRFARRSRENSAAEAYSASSEISAAQLAAQADVYAAQAAQPEPAPAPQPEPAYQPAPYAEPVQPEPSYYAPEYAQEAYASQPYAQEQYAAEPYYQESYAPERDRRPMEDSRRYDRRDRYADRDRDRDRRSRRSDDYYRDDDYRRYDDRRNDRYDDDDYDDYRERRGRRYDDRRAPYGSQPDYPPYGQYPAYPANYSYPYPYGQYPVYPPYAQYPGYPPYGYPPGAYPPGYAYPAGAAPMGTVPVQEPPAEAPAVQPVLTPVSEPVQTVEEQPVENLPSPPPPRKSVTPVVFPETVDSAPDEEFAGLNDTAPQPVQEQPAAAPVESAPDESSPAPARPQGSSRFNRRSRSGSDASAPQPAAAEPVEPQATTEAPAQAAQEEKPASRFNPTSRRTDRFAPRTFDEPSQERTSDPFARQNDDNDWFKSGESTTDISTAGGSSRFNRRSRS